MKKTTSTARLKISEEIAAMAERGEDISTFFTNKGKMMPPKPSDGEQNVVTAGA